MKIGNITFDCANPRSLSHFWSDVLGYPRAEYPPQLREQLLANGLTEEDLLQRSIAEDPKGEGPRLFFQKVPEGKDAKNRIHLDISATPGRIPTREEVESEVERIVALGATLIGKVDTQWGLFPEYHYTLTDPEGNEFCVQ
ncbi:VOC family protein [Natronoglycomyces albus]|uniref:Glyoxalase-like domain-containing protein n=1 Tax=Natronoglycomyces albus TaxID=2811108 RepID=A0A895XR64_9ACTN|nr:VOC family protein [Natronoglycomyces albus]QSB04760.1 hypothetical protein JQS30_13450 [Natronoglycomyces albus]